MPYGQSFNTAENVHIMTWHLTETLDELITLWGNENYPHHYVEATAEKRRREILATALLLRQLFGHDIELRHAANGARIIDKGNISISHTATHVAIALHPTRSVGVDIETIGKRAVRVASRFLSPYELAQLPDEENSVAHTTAIHIAWTVKEAIFKIHPTAIEFRRDIILSPIPTAQRGSVMARLSDSIIPIEAHYLHYNGCILAWSVQ